MKKKNSGQEILVPGKTGQEKEVFEMFFILTILKKNSGFYCLPAVLAMTKDLMGASKKITVNFTAIF